MKPLKERKMSKKRTSNTDLGYIGDKLWEINENIVKIANELGKIRKIMELKG